MEKVFWCFPGVVMILAGAAFFARPGAFLKEFDEDLPADPATPPPARTLRRIRLTGVAFVAVGLVVLYFVLFGKPAEDPVLF